MVGFVGLRSSGAIHEVFLRYGWIAEAVSRGALTAPGKLEKRRGLLRSPTAIDRQRDARDARRGIAAQEHGDVACLQATDYTYRSDLAVIQAPSAEDVAQTVGELVRVARQGLITRR